MSSAEVNLTTFRQILLLPLALTGMDGEVAAAVHKIANNEVKEHGGWTEQADHLAHLGSSSDAFAYGEFVYFHAYIQDFLYDRAADGMVASNRPLRLFKRTDPGSLAIELSARIFDEAGEVHGESSTTANVSISLPIQRLSLYLFELGVAILVLEVALEEDPRVTIGGRERPFTLAHALALQNALRRIYPPYFPADAIRSDKTDGIPEYPASLRWSRAGNLLPRKPSQWIEHVANHRRNPIDAVWVQMLAPLRVEESSAVSGPRWRQIIDERIPSMTFLGAGKEGRIERSEFVRLCFMDNPNEGYPYAEEFVRTFEQEHCYDRFWYGTHGTRYLFSGYSMIMFGTGDPAKADDFFHYALVHHFRRHYFQIGLLLQLQLAALLSLSHRVSEAVREKPIIGFQKFRQRMLGIEEEMLAFEQRYWFSQISNQDQPREIYRKWIGNTGIEAIYSEAREQIHAANAYLDSREQAAQTSAATRLSVIATFGVIVGAALAFLGMNVLASADFLAALGVPKDLSPANMLPSKALLRLVCGHLATFAFILALFATAGRFLLNRYRAPQYPGDAATREQTTTWRLNRDLGYFGLGSLSFAIIFALLARLSG